LTITTIKESFKIDKEDYVVDPDGNEMILVRGETYSVLRLYKHYGIADSGDNIREGIMIIVSDGEKQLCLFADQLIGEQQVVVKPLPNYIKRIDGISGCAILGDGGISLILDLDGLLRI
jgi:two-component system chemotaxis sensor kinase CheA